MAFSVNTRSRSFVVTMQISNMEKAGLKKEEYENPEYLAEYLCNLWESSGKGRKAGVAVCVSLKGLYHAHIACYGNTTTLKKVSDIFFSVTYRATAWRKAGIKSISFKRRQVCRKRRAGLML